jgi:hypothetical protein
MNSPSSAYEKNSDTLTRSANINMIETSITNDSINVLKGSKDKISIDVNYMNDSISIEIRGKKKIKVFYKSPIDEILPCVGILIKEGAQQISYSDHYIYQDSILLLPVQDINNRINLFVININSGNLIPIIKPVESDFLTTAYPWFGFDSGKGVIISTNSIPLQGKTTIHKYKLSAGLRYVKTFSEKINTDVVTEEKAMEKIMMKLLS